MILRNKKTGGLIEIYVVKDQLKFRRLDGKTNEMMFNSLAELNEDWEDYEEPKEHYFITEYGGVFSLNEYKGLNNVANPEDYKVIGNYFETEEEAEEAVEKLKAWKRLKDKGFKFSGYHIPAGEIHFDMEIPKDSLEEIAKDMGVCFGGE